VPTTARARLPVRRAAGEPLSRDAHQALPAAGHGAAQGVPVGCRSAPVLVGTDGELVGM
jgi:hypothetical protein